MKGLKSLISILLSAVLAASLLTAGASAEPADTAAEDATLHTEGNLLVKANGEADGVGLPFVERNIEAFTHLLGVVVAPGQIGDIHTDQADRLAVCLDQQVALGVQRGVLGGRIRRLG